MDPVTGVFLFILFLIGFTVIISRKRETDRQILPAPVPSATPAPEPPSRTPSLYELAGILIVQHEDRMGDWTFVEKDGREYNADPKREIDPQLLGCFLADFSFGHSCHYCSGRLVKIDQILHKTPPGTARDMGLVERAKVGVYCEACGLEYEGEDSLTRKFPSNCSMMPHQLRRFDMLLEAFANDSRKLKEIRWRMLSEQYARLQPLTVKIADEMNRLHAELYPRTDLDPFRGTPLESQNEKTTP